MNELEPLPLSWRELCESVNGRTTFYLCNGCSHLSMRRIEEIVEPVVIECCEAVGAFAKWCRL